MHLHKVIYGELTELSIPSMISMKKKRRLHAVDPGRVAIAWG